MQVGLFITCLTEQFYPRTGIACVKVIESLGHTVLFPPEQTCCGQPMFNAGFHDDSRALALRMIGVFQSSSTVVTPSGSCCSMVREHFPALFTIGTPERARADQFAAKTYEFVEFLTTVLKVDLGSMNLRWGGDAVYHPSCHLRGLGLSGQTPQVLAQIGGLTLKPLEMAEQCCGFGGTFAMKFPQVSGDLARDKAACIGRSGAGTLVCNDAGCGLNIEGTCKREGIQVQMKSAAEIIAEAMGLLAKDER